MSKIECYIQGALFGMIAEYCYRVNCGLIEIFTLVVLFISILIDVFQSKHQMKKPLIYPIMFALWIALLLTPFLLTL